MADIFDTVADEPEAKQDLFDKVADAPTAPIEPDPAKKAEAESMMGEAWKTVQDIGHVYPVAEAAAHVITNLYGLPVSGIAGLVGLIGGTDTSEKWMKFVQDALIYQPQTQRGQRTTQSAMYPFELLQKGGQYAGDKAMELGAPWYVAASIKTLIEGAPAVVGLRHAPKVVRGAIDTLSKTQTWRQATIKERGLVVQTLEETLAKNPKITEAELIKQSDTYFKQALERRMVKKQQEAKATQEASRKMGEEVAEVEPVQAEVSPAVNNIFKEVGAKIEGIKVDEALVRTLEERFEIPKEPIRPQDITEYEQIAGEASRRALERVQKGYAREDRAALAASRKFGREFAEQDPAITDMTDTIASGGISRKSLIDAGVGKQEVASLARRRPGLIKKDGTLSADRVANDYGFDTADELVQDWLSRPTKRDVAKRIAEQDYAVYESSIDFTRDLTARQMVLEEEINVLKKLTKKKDPTTTRGLKKIVNELTGVTKVKQVLDKDTVYVKQAPTGRTGQAKTVYGVFTGKQVGKVKARESKFKGTLNDLLKLEERAAKKAFNAGKYEASLQHKLNQRELRLRKQAIERQRKESKKMIKALKKIDTSKMSPQNAAPINKLIADIDFTRLSKKKKLSLESLRRHLEKNPETELPEGRIKELSRLDNVNISDISFDQLTAIYESALHYVHIEGRKNFIKVGRKRRQRKEVVKDSINEMIPGPELETQIVTSQQGGKKPSKVGRLITESFGIRQDHYDLVVESLAGPNSIMDKVLFQGVKQGIIDQYKYRQDAFAKFTKDIKPIVKKVGPVDTWLNETVKTGRFELTRNERMALFRHYLIPDNRAAILSGGIGFRHSKTPNRIYKITAKELDEVLNSLTKEEIDFASAPVDELYADQAAAMEKVFYEKNGYPMPRVEDYYPKEVMPLARGTDIQTESALELFKGKFIRVGVDKGMLLKRVGSKQPIYLNGLTYDLNKSVLRAAAYVGLELPLSEASALLYDNNFRLQISDRYGEVVWKEIEKGLRDIAGDFSSYTSVEELMLKAKNNLSTAVLGFNPFVMLKQVLSLPVYAPYVSGDYLAQGLSNYLANKKAVEARHSLHSPEWVERIDGGYSRDVADVFKSSSEKRLYGGAKRFREKSMGGIVFFDRGAVAPGMEGAVLQVLDEFKAGKLSEKVKTALDITDEQIPKLTASDKMRLAYRYADYATERSQPMFSPEHRSSLSRGSATEKLFTMFGSFTNQALNLIRRSHRDYKRAKTKAQKEAAAKTMAEVLFILGVLNPLGVMAIDRIRDAIYGRENTSSWAGRIINSWASYVFFLRDIVSSTISKIERGSFMGYDVDVPVMVLPNLAADTMAAGYEALSNPSKAKQIKASKEFVDKSLQLIFTANGIPYSVPKKLAERGFVAAKETIGD